MNYILGIICQWKGHKWSRAVNVAIGASVKTCNRCGAEKYVQSRPRKAKP